MPAAPELSFWTRSGLGAAVTVLIGTAALLAANAIATGTPESCVETGCFCEAVSSGIPAQLFASVSSVAFVLLGAWVILQRGPANPRERRTIPLAGIAMIAIGVSSFGRHATLTFLGQWLDVFSMYLLGLPMALGALRLLTLLVLASIIRLRPERLVCQSSNRTPGSGQIAVRWEQGP